MQNFDDLDIEGRNPSHLSEEEREKDEHDRKRLMRSSVTAEDGTLRPVYSLTEDDDVWCHICNVSLFGAHKLLSHNSGNRHKMKLDECPYPVSLWSSRADASATMMKKNRSPGGGHGAPIGDSLAPGEPVPPGMEDQLTRSTSIQVSLDRHRTSPLVGLEYLLEIVDNESCEPSYTCVLCDKRGDPRTVMAHITSYNHRITYLNRHFPTVSRAITDLPRTPNYKRGANEISVLVAKKIEERFGRLQPQLVDKNQFEKNKLQYIKRVYQDYHFRETPELTFMDVYDVRWVTNFDEKMAEVSAASKKEAAPAGRHNKYSNPYEYQDNAEVTIEEKPKREEKKRDDKERFAKKVEPKEKEKTGMKIRILTKEKLNAMRKPDERSKSSGTSAAIRPSDDTKSLSSLSSISSSPSPSRSRSRSRSRGRRTLSNSASAAPPASLSDRLASHKYRGSRAARFSRSRSRSPEPLRERDKWDKYREQIRRAEETLDRALKFHEKNPEKHPSYPDEWKKFWNRRYKELQAEGKDPGKHDFKPEWIEFWNKRMREIHNEQLQQRKEEIRKRLELPEDRPPEKTERFERSERSERSERERPERSERQRSERSERERSERLERSERSERSERPEAKSAERAEKWPPVVAISSRDKRDRSPSSSAKRTRHLPDSDDDVEYVGTKTVKTDYHDRHDPPPSSRDRDYGYTYARSRTGGIYRPSSYYPSSRVHAAPSRRRYSPYRKDKSPSPTEKEEPLREDLEIVGLLRLLTALEGQLGSLGPKVVSLLSRALAAEKAKPNSADELLHDEEVSVLFETVKEKLKGQLFAGMIEKMAIAATKSAITNIAQLVHKAAEEKRKLDQLAAQLKIEEEEKRKKRELEMPRPLAASFANSSRSIYQRALQQPLRSEPVSVPGVGAVDKVAIAQQIAAALVAQGRTNVSQDELETLINAVVGMAEASQHSDKPITAASFVQGLAAAAQAAPPAQIPTAQVSVAQIPTAHVSDAQMSTAHVPVVQMSTAHVPVAQMSTAHVSVAQMATAQIPTAHVAAAQMSTAQPVPHLNSAETLNAHAQRSAPSPPMAPKLRDDRDTPASRDRDSQPPEPMKSMRMESLSDNDLKTLLQNFKDLGTDEQHGLINFLKKLEATDPPRVEKLRGFVNLGTPAQHSNAAKNPTPPRERPPSRAQHSKGGMRSTSPFSTRKGNQNPTDDDSKWKPKLDMFADDEEMQQQKLKKQAAQDSAAAAKRSKAKIDISDDDDDDYTFEDIYKAADKNVNESERARKRKSPNDASPSRSWSRSRSRSPSRSRISASEKSRDGAASEGSDPNAILNETKRLIANIMGDLPNKYVVKSHATTNQKSDECAALAAIPMLPVPQQNLYGANYPQQQQQQQQMAAPGQNYQQYANYQQQSFNPNSGYMNNGYNYNQAYGNMGGMMTNSQSAYGATAAAAAMQGNQYGQQTQQAPQQQQAYPMAQQYGAGGAPIGYPQQQYGNYAQQRFY